MRVRVEADRTTGADVKVRLKLGQRARVRSAYGGLERGDIVRHTRVSDSVELRACGRSRRAVRAVRAGECVLPPAATRDIALKLSRTLPTSSPAAAAAAAVAVAVDATPGVSPSSLEHHHFSARVSSKLIVAAAYKV